MCVSVRGVCARCVCVCVCVRGVCVCVCVCVVHTLLSYADPRSPPVV